MLRACLEWKGKKDWSKILDFSQQKLYISSKGSPWSGHKSLPSFLYFLFRNKISTVLRPGKLCSWKIKLATKNKGRWCRSWGGCDQLRRRRESRSEKAAVGSRQPEQVAAAAGRRRSLAAAGPRLSSLNGTGSDINLIINTAGSRKGHQTFTQIHSQQMTER